MFLTLAIIVWLSGEANANVLIPLLFAWAIAKALVLPLWASIIAGMVGTGERGLWLEMRRLRPHGRYDLFPKVQAPDNICSGCG